jgi:hypothetical protein
MTEHPAAIALSTLTCALLAQIADAPPAGIPGIVTTMTSTGVLVWYLWWTTTRTIPGIIERFEKRIAVITEAFERQLEAERSSHRIEIHDVRGLAAQAVSQKEYAAQLEARLARGSPKKAAGDPPVD